MTERQRESLAAATAPQRLERQEIDGKVLLKDAEAAAALSMSRSTFRLSVAKGILPRPIKIGGMTRWRAVDILTTLDRIAGL
jgi:predicted DNA-binding transcriptional regulator AlpA